MSENEKYDLYGKIIDRAMNVELISFADFIGFMTDIESANEKFNLHLKEWLEADDVDFTHDFYGIQDNIKRNRFPATDFGSFVPHFAD